MRFDARLLNISKILDFFCSGEKFSSVVSSARTSDTSLSLLNPFSKASPFLEALFDDFFSSNEVCFFDCFFFVAETSLREFVISFGGTHRLVRRLIGGRSSLFEEEIFAVQFFSRLDFAVFCVFVVAEIGPVDGE